MPHQSAYLSSESVAGQIGILNCGLAGTSSVLIASAVLTFAFSCHVRGANRCGHEWGRRLCHLYDLSSRYAASRLITTHSLLGMRSARLTTTTPAHRRSSLQFPCIIRYSRALVRCRPVFGSKSCELTCATDTHLSPAISVVFPAHFCLFSLSSSRVVVFTFPPVYALTRLSLIVSVYGLLFLRLSESYSTCMH